MTREPGRTEAPPQVPVEALLRAVEEVSSLAPDLGWSEASGVAEAVLDGVAHRLADAATAREEPTPLPLVVGAIGGPDRLPDHASCRAAAARLRTLAPLLEQRHTSWERRAGSVMADLGDLLDRIADRTRSGSLTFSDKGVALRRLHALQRSLRADQGPGAVP